MASDEREKEAEDDVQQIISELTDTWHCKMSPYKTQSELERRCVSEFSDQCNMVIFQKFEWVRFPARFPEYPR